MKMRDGTQDEIAYREVFVENQYRLPNKIGGTVIDIGAHIGSFALACLQRGASRVVCFEPCPKNFALLQENTAQHSRNHRVVTINCGVWRSDKHEKLAFLSAGINTACGMVTPKGGDTDSIGLDGIIETYGPISLLKIDAEASEYPILYTSRRLREIPSIVGETHAVGLAHGEVMAAGFPREFLSHEGLRFVLERRGFNVGIEPERDDNKYNHLFWAHRNRVAM